MTDAELDKLFELAEEVEQLWNEQKLAETKAMLLRLENSQANYDGDFEKAVCRKYCAGFLIDLGQAIDDEAMVQRGTQYLQEWVDKFASKDELASAYYNLANGYLGLWGFHSETLSSDPTDKPEHRLARHYYREAIQLLQSEKHSKRFACEVWTNYGLALMRVGREIEAIDAFDAALHIDPQMGMALANKGFLIANMALDMYGHTHLFFLEARMLLEAALKQPLTTEVRAGVIQTLDELIQIFEAHHEMKPETGKNIKPANGFHRFLCEFCAQHGLFLNPMTFLGDEGKTFYGDPAFISKMYAGIAERAKFDRYVTFLNEIKQDYVLGRYLLVQSQYASSEIDAIDDGVELFYPLDYSMNSSYIQMLKTANKQAIAILDKIAYFIYDYCKLKTPELTRVYFRDIWGGNEKIRNDFRSFASPYLFALFTLANDVSKKGDWHKIYEHRDALTHRFLVVQELQIGEQSNPDIPRKDFRTFLQDTILAFKIARAAIMYLILFVEHQEEIEGRNTTEQTVPIHPIRLDDGFRYRPK